MRNYIQRMRAIRDMNRLINELESHENEWKHTSLAARNRLLLKKWKEQIGVSLYLAPLNFHPLKFWYGGGPKLKCPKVGGHKLKGSKI